MHYYERINKDMIIENMNNHIITLFMKKKTS